MPTLNEYLLMSGLLFVIGLSGVLLRGNIIVILMSLEMMLSAANLALVSFWRFGGGGLAAAAADGRRFLPGRLRREQRR